MYSNLAILAVFGFAFSAVAGRIERSRVSGPIMFIFFGLVAGPLGLGLLDMDGHDDIPGAGPLGGLPAGHHAGSGFIACFVGGLLFGDFARDRTHALVLAGEGIAELLAMLTWVVFGAVMVGQSWTIMSWEVLAYSLLSLTVIRMLPMLLALTGSGEALGAAIGPGIGREGKNHIKTRQVKHTCPATIPLDSMDLNKSAMPTGMCDYLI